MAVEVRYKRLGGFDFYAQTNTTADERSAHVDRPCGRLQSGAPMLRIKAWEFSFVEIREKEVIRMKLKDRAGRDVSARDVALAACRELVQALGEAEVQVEVRRAAVLARFALAMKD